MVALEVSGLSKRYGRLLAVDDVSFGVERGAVFGLLGRNGSGKTTIVSCALGLRRPSQGHAEVLGIPAGELHRTRGRVGVVFDAPILVKGLSVRGQMRYSLGLFGHRDGRSASEALGLVGLGRLGSRRVQSLSLGQQKRLAVATALAGAPELLVLDEPLSGLDPLGARDLLGLFGELSDKGLTILISSHRLNDIEPVLSHAAVLDGGRLVVQGRLADLLGSEPAIEVRVDDVQGARSALAALKGVVVNSGREPGTLLVEGAQGGPAEVGRTLVEAGLALMGLRSTRRSLAELFESLTEGVTC